MFTHECPECSGPLQEIQGARGHYFWRCDDGAHPLLRDHDGEPGEPVAYNPDRGELDPDHLCLKCDAPMTKREARIEGYHWWGCSRFPVCRGSYTPPALQAQYIAERRALAGRRRKMAA